MLSRRGIFGAAAGAAVAGPQVMKEAMQTTASGLPTPGMPMMGNAGEKLCDVAKPMTPEDWLQNAQKTKAHIEHLRKGDLTEYMGRYDRHHHAFLSIESLKSVSPQHKARMRIEAEARTRWMEELERALQNFDFIKGQLGPLKDLI